MKPVLTVLVVLSVVISVRPAAAQDAEKITSRKAVAATRDYDAKVKKLRAAYRKQRAKLDDQFIDDERSARSQLVAVLGARLAESASAGDLKKTDELSQLVQSVNKSVVDPNLTGDQRGAPLSIDLYFGEVPDQLQGKWVGTFNRSKELFSLLASSSGFKLSVTGSPTAKFVKGRWSASDSSGRLYEVLPYFENFIVIRWAIPGPMTQRRHRIPTDVAIMVLRD